MFEQKGRLAVNIDINIYSSESDRMRFIVNVICLCCDPYSLWRAICIVKRMPFNLHRYLRVHQLLYEPCGVCAEDALLNYKMGYIM